MKRDTVFHKILVQTEFSCISQCNCCTEIQIQYKNILLALDWKSLVTFIKRLDDAPESNNYYIIETSSQRDKNPSHSDFAATGMFLTVEEAKEFRHLLHLACERVDLEMIFRNTIHAN